MNSWKSIAVALLVLAAHLVTCPEAHATPYSIIAKYKPNGSGGTAVELMVADNDALPRTTMDYTLDGIYLRLNTDDASKTALASLRNLAVALECQTPGCEASKKQLEIKPVSVPRGATTDTLILGGEELASGGSSERLVLQVHSKFDAPTFLCGQELALRSVSTKTVESWTTTIAPYVKGLTAQKLKDGTFTADVSKLTTAQMNVISTLSRKALTFSNGDPILYSFCPDIKDAVDWAARAGKDPLTPASIDLADKERDRHKHELSLQLKAALEQPGGFANVQVAPDAPGLPENIFVSDVRPFALMKELGAEFKFDEVDKEAREISKLINQTSEILLVADDRKFCQGNAKACEALVVGSLIVYLETTDANKAIVRKDITLVSRGGNRWSLGKAWQDYFDTDIAFVLAYKHGGQEMLLRRDPVHVENLGLIMSAPVISELVSLFGATSSAKEATFKSSIPVSWAFNATRGEGRQAAVTFPWMMGYNPRWAPKLADYIKIFPHASAIFPISDDDSAKPELALGAGIALANAFTIAYGATTASGNSYLLLGISIPDLVNVAK